MATIHPVRRHHIKCPKIQKEIDFWETIFETLGGNAPFVLDLRCSAQERSGTEAFVCTQSRCASVHT